MMQAFAIGLVRAWTRIYTWGMHPRAGERRVAEIESDLWDSVHSGDGAGMILARLLCGVFDDLVWRTSHDLINERATRRTAVVGAIVTFATLVVVAALWVIDAGRAAQLPEPPAIMQFVAAPPPPQPPPPPPPPPCKSPSLGGCNASTTLAPRANGGDPRR